MKTKKKNLLFEDVITTISRCFIVLVVVVVICIGFSGVSFVKPGEVAIVLRFGKVVGDTQEEQIHEPGILFAFPYIIDEVVTVPTGTVMERVIETHYSDIDLKDSNVNNIGYLITGDNNIAVMKVSVKYTITDPVKYALKVNNVEKIIDACVSNAMLEKTAAMNFDEILTTGKDKLATEIRTAAQASINANNLGVTIVNFEFLNLQPPSDVKPNYDSVNASAIQKEQTINDAKQNASQIITEATVSADKMISDERAIAESKISKAKTDLSEFWGTIDEYEESFASRAVVRTRIKNEKLTKAISSIGEIIAVKNGDGHIIIN